MVRLSFDPCECHRALARARGPVVVDIETTGLLRTSSIVSVGVLVDCVAYILFARSLHCSVVSLPWNVVAEALTPLSRKDLIVVGHNFKFDLGFLNRAGVSVGGEVRDTLAILRLLDQDRLGGGGGRRKRFPRRDLRAPEHAPVTLDYRLKHVAGQLLGLHLIDFPGQVELLHRDAHAKYLASDLVGTRALYEHLWAQLPLEMRRYYHRFVSPLIPVTLRMSATGVRADADFASTEADHLDRLRSDLAEEHERLFGVPLGMDRAALERWLFVNRKLPKLKWNRQGSKWTPSLDDDALDRLDKYAEDPATKNSLQLIRQYRQASSLLVRLRSLLRYVDDHSRRIHTDLDDRQASGRLSSTGPNLQQVAKMHAISGTEIRSRNVLVATPGYELAVFDVAQADVRVLAAMVENFPHSSVSYQNHLRRTRHALLGGQLTAYLPYLRTCRNPGFVGQPTAQREFDPAMPRSLANAFRQGGDFYSQVATKMLGRPPIDRAERNKLKPVVLAVINGKGPPSLAKDLECTRAEAGTHLTAFDA